jgi:hypothetical protein
VLKINTMEEILSSLERLPVTVAVNVVICLRVMLLKQVSSATRKSTSVRIMLVKTKNGAEMNILVTILYLKEKMLAKLVQSAQVPVSVETSSRVLRVNAQPMPTNRNVVLTSTLVLPRHLQVSMPVMYVLSALMHQSARQRFPLMVLHVASTHRVLEVIIIIVMINTIVNIQHPPHS